MTLIQNRRGTTEEWLAANPVLKLGEIGVELTVSGDIKFKIGNGGEAWVDLGYAQTESSLPAMSLLALNILASSLPSEVRRLLFAVADDDWRLSNKRAPIAGSVSLESLSDTLTNLLVTTVGAQALSNKRINPRVVQTVSGTSLTPNISVADKYVYTALAANLSIHAPVGVPLDGNRLVFCFKDNGTPRTLTWDSTFRAVGTTLPTTTVAQKYTYVFASFNDLAVAWDVIDVRQQDSTEDFSTATLKNKSIALGDNTLTGTLAQFNTALGDADFVDTLATEVANTLVSGESTMPRRMASSSLPTGSGVLRLSYFTAQKTETITALDTVAVSGGTNATLQKMVVYSVGSDGTLTEVARTDSILSLWTSSSTSYSAPLVSSWNKVRGTRYAMGVLYVNGGSGTAPNLSGTNGCGSGAEAAKAPRLSGFVSGLSDLPSSPVASGSILNTPVIHYVAMVPA